MDDVRVPHRIGRSGSGELHGIRDGDPLAARREKEAVSLVCRKGMADGATALTYNPPRHVRAYDEADGSLQTFSRM